MGLQCQLVTPGQRNFWPAKVAPPLMGPRPGRRRGEGGEDNWWRQVSAETMDRVGTGRMTRFDLPSNRSSQQQLCHSSRTSRPSTLYHAPFSARGSRQQHVFPSPVLAVEGASAAPRSLHAPAALRPLSPRSNLRPASQFTSDRPARAEHGRPSTSGVIGRPKPPLDLSFPNANYRSRLVKKKLTTKKRGGSPDTAGAREALAQRNAEDKAIQLIAGNGLPWLSQTPEPESPRHPERRQLKPTDDGAYTDDGGTTLAKSSCGTGSLWLPASKTGQRVGWSRRNQSSYLRREAKEDYTDALIKGVRESGSHKQVVS